jgi:hypothetical protein
MRLNVRSPSTPEVELVQSKIGQRIMGFFVFLLGSGFTAWSWYTALNDGYYYVKAAALFPVLAVVGLAAILFPIDVERLRNEHGVDKPTKFAHYPQEWKIVIVVAVAAGLGNLLAISKW